VRLGAQRPAAAREPQPPAQKALYKQLMNGFYDAILIADSKGHVVESNIRAPEFFGYSNDDLWDMPASDLIAGLNEAVYDRIRHAIGGERHVLMNTRCTRKDGTHFPAEVGISVIAMLGKDDFVFTIRNVERRAAQLRNLRSAQNAFMNAQAGCFVCDTAKHIVTVNNAFMAILRLASSVPVAGVPIEQFIPAVSMHLDRVAAGETIVFQCTMTLGGAEQTLVVSLAPNRQGTSQIDGVVGSILPASATTTKA
jgi:PAS domain S-box-containing protein